MINSEPDIKTHTENTSPPSNDYLANIIRSVMSSSAENTSHTNNNSGTESVGISSNSSTANSDNKQSDIISSLLSNPELIAKLPTLISTVKPLIELIASSDNSIAKAQPTISSLPETPQNSTNKPEIPNHNDQRFALLIAIKPYLGHDRQNAIDYILKLSHLGSILKNL